MSVIGNLLTQDSKFRQYPISSYDQVEGVEGINEMTLTTEWILVVEITLTFFMHLLFFTIVRTQHL